MTNKMRIFLSSFWGKISMYQIAGLLGRNLEDRTKYSWAKSIKSYQSVPDIYKDFFVLFQEDAQEFPYTVLIPSFENDLHQTTEKLICNFEHSIYILEQNGNNFETQCFPINQISHVEVKAILLDSRIKICGVTQDGIPDSATFRFNSVTDYLFTPILQRIRQATIELKLSPNRSELENFDRWKGVNFKFMSYAKRSLLAEEKVIYAILQSEIRETVLQFLGRTYNRVVAPTLACILTDQELIMIHEEKVQSRETRYGGVWDYIPVKKILTLSLKDQGKNLLALSIHLTEGTRLEYLFHSDAKREINQLQYQFTELMIT